jgi:hypothetical protein
MFVVRCHFGVIPLGIWKGVVWFQMTPAVSITLLRRDFELCCATLQGFAMNAAALRQYLTHVQYGWQSGASLVRLPYAAYCRAEYCWERSWADVIHGDPGCDRPALSFICGPDCLLLSIVSTCCRAAWLLREL